MKVLNAITAPKTIRPEKVVQFGEGNFLRAFVDWIINKMNQSTDFNGSVVIVQPLLEGRVPVLNEQDGLYYLHLQGIEQGKVVDSVELIDSVSRGINPYKDPEAYFSLAEQPDIRFIISNTTEAGIAFDPTCCLDDKPASSYPGKLTQFLYHRYLHFKGDTTKGCFIMPCELIFENGKRLKETINQYISHWNLEDGFKTWFDTCCPVYSTLVDRIVPGYPKKTADKLKERIQYDDKMLDEAECFHLWVIEAPKTLADYFPADKAGLNVLFVPSEQPYHERKVTLLNGPHTVLSPVAFLSGIDIVRDACQHPVVGQYINKVMFEELMETLDLPKEELISFAKSVWERFINPFVDHQVTSIMLNAFPKFKTRDLPGLKRFLQRKGVLPQGIVLGLAAIITYYKGGIRKDGTPILPSDDNEILKFVESLWMTEDIDKIAKGVLGASFIWGEDLNEVPGLTCLLKKDLLSIQENGMLETVQNLINHE